MATEYFLNLKDDNVMDVLCLYRLLHLWFLRHALEPETEPVLGASIASCGGRSVVYLCLWFRWRLRRLDLGQQLQHNLNSPVTGNTNRSFHDTKNKREWNKENQSFQSAFDTFPHTTATLPPTVESHQSQLSSEHIDPHQGSPHANTLVMEEYIISTKPPRFFPSFFVLKPIKS